MDNMPPNTERVTDWETGRYVVEGQETFKEYEIYVQANNNQGPSPANIITKMIGFSGEGSKYQLCTAQYSRINILVLITCFKGVTPIDALRRH